MATTTVAITGKPYVTDLGNRVMKVENLVDFSVAGTQTTSTDVIQVLPIPKGAFVFSVGTYVHTVSTGTGDINSVGDGSAVDGWIAADLVCDSAADTSHSLVSDTYPALGGKLYTAADTIDFTMKTAVNTDGKMLVWAIYTIIEAVANA